MGLDATDLLGSAELAGVKVNPRGLGKAIMARNMHTAGAPGVLGAAITAVADVALQKRFERSAQQQRDETAGATTPTFPKIAWLAVTAQEVALAEVSTRTTLKLTGALLARVPRVQVTSVELNRSKRMPPTPLVLTFADGQRWALEVPAGSKKDAERLVDLLAPPTAAQSAL